MNRRRSIELLSPAANAETAIEAILHGADAVYIGPPSHGARKSASNSIEDIKKVVEFAHIYRAKVYVTVNTIVYDHELKHVEKMIWDLWKIGVDALIVQDMGILRMNLPPIPLHASTQCDTRTPEKAKFLEEAGFSQIVLGRELTLEEIKTICRSVKVPVECFVHGALCVSYSGVCHASQAFKDRSANRGECAQLCRLPYKLTDSTGKELIECGHLLSLKDFNLLDSLDKLILAGVSSFKIEGRLKEVGYVKNITALYSRKLNTVIENLNSDEKNINPEILNPYIRSSYGDSEIDFQPAADKSFNRGFTHYFLDDRKPRNISEHRTPKSLGEIVDNPDLLNPGDGISWFDKTGSYQGMLVNSIDNGKVTGPKGFRLPSGIEIHRTADRIWNKKLQSKTATRKINLDLTIDKEGISAKDERGCYVRITMPPTEIISQKPMDLNSIFSKLGNTPYRLREFINRYPDNLFIPASELNGVKRNLLKTLNEANINSYPLETRKQENRLYPFIKTKLDYTFNVANHLAEEFYRDHGVIDIERGAELKSKEEMTGKQIMLTRHCILREAGMCKKQNKRSLSEPLFLDGGNGIRFRLLFDCERCEMKLLKA